MFLYLQAFVRDSGASFTDSTFTQYWDQTMARTEARRFNVSYFAPTAARSIFVIHFTDVAPEEMWEGASTVMGNSVRAWNRVYWRDKRQKQVNKVVTAMSSIDQGMVSWG